MKNAFCIRFLIVAAMSIFTSVSPAQQLKVFSRHSYYSAENEVTIIAKLDSQRGGDYSFSVYDGGKLMAGSADLASDKLSVKIPADSFGFGRKILQYAVFRDGQSIGEGELEITRLPAKANEVKIDRLTGGLIADGLPFFPVGFYCRPVLDLPEQEVTNGFNLIGPYQSNLPEGLAERKEYMDRCARVGMKVQYSVNSLVGSGHNGAKGLDMTEDEKLEILKSEVIAFRDHPALLSWYINDEPDGQGRPPSLIERAYQAVKELDPYHPVSVVLMLPSKFYLFRNSMDIAMTDPYPIPGPVAMVEEYLSQMNRDFPFEKSIWLVPQAFGGQEMWTREPTANEIRLMTYLGLINGVKGIQYYTHAPGNGNPQSVSAWSACSDMAAEINQMATFLLSEENPAPVITSVEGIVLKSFSYKGDLLVIAANKENIPKSFQVSLEKSRPGASHSSKAILWFENREIAMHDGMIEDIIDALGTRVYLVKGDRPVNVMPVNKGNLTINPGFETIVSPGLPIGSNTRKSFPGKYEKGASFFADPRQAVEGMFSLRLVTPVDSASQKIRLLPVVLKEKTSYAISFWAKAKAQERRPVFRIGLDRPATERTFTLSEDWQNYSFFVHPDSTYSSAILSFDLISAGTAWVDMVQINPEPAIGYIFNDGKTATVTISTDLPGARLIFKTVNGDLAGKTRDYATAFRIDRACMVHAELVDGEDTLARSGLFIPLSKALRKKAWVHNKYAPQYASSGDEAVTDGLMGSTAFKDGRWLGFLDTAVIVTIDLEKAENVKEVNVNFLADPNSGIFLPPEILLYISADGNDYKLADRWVNRNGTPRKDPWLQNVTLRGKNIKGRYVKVMAKPFGEIPGGYLFKGTKSWIFLDEIRVD